MNWKKWLYGLIAAGVNGVASGIVLVIAAPETFNLEAGLQKLLATAGVLGIWGAANYLKQNPVPAWDGVDRRALVPLLLAAVLLSGMLGCAKAPPNLTPEGQKAYTADQIVVRVNRLMDTAIDAEAAKALPTATTRVIVRFCVEADKTLAQLPAGWGPTLYTAWHQVKEDPLVKPYLLQNQYIATAASVIDLALAMFAPTPPKEPDLHAWLLWGRGLEVIPC